MRTTFLLLLAAAAFAVPPFAFADDPALPSPAPPAKTGDRGAAAASPHEIAFGVDVAKFDVRRDADAGTMTFRLTTPGVRLASAPTVVLKTASGSQTVALVPVDDRAGEWRLSHALLRQADFSATMEIVVGGKTYSAPIAGGGTPSPAASQKGTGKHGGRVIAFANCEARIEVVHDSATGTLTIYPGEDTTLESAPVVHVDMAKGAGDLPVTPASEEGAWKVVNDSLRAPTLTGAVHITLRGSPCDAPLAAASKGALFVMSPGGPSFEILRNERDRTYSFYAVDETLDGKAYRIDSPAIVVQESRGARTLSLSPIEGEKRAWRLSGFEPATEAPTEARLTFSIGGKPFETHVRLVGFAHAK